jgi:hypothetical protein
LQFYFSFLCLFFRLEFRQLWRPKHIVLFPYYYISSKRILSFTCHVVVCAIFPSSSAAAGKIASCQKELSLLTFEASATREREREREGEKERKKEREKEREKRKKKRERADHPWPPRLQQQLTKQTRGRLTHGLYFYVAFFILAHFERFHEYHHARAIGWPQKAGPIVTRVR